MDEEELKIYNQGICEGMKHQMPSGETTIITNGIKKEISELKKEWDELKGKLLRYYLTFLIVVASYGIWVGTIQTTINQHEVADNKMETQIVEIDKRQQSSDITSAEIKTKLAGIEASLVDIKEALKIK